MLNPKNFKKASDPIIDWIDNYMKNIAEYPVKSKVKPGDVYEQIPNEAPDESEPMEKIIKDLEEVILPGISHWQHPNFEIWEPTKNTNQAMICVKRMFDKGWDWEVINRRREDYYFGVEFFKDTPLNVCSSETSLSLAICKAIERTLDE